MKKELKTELTKEKIINAAIDEFGTKGYAGASLNAICGAGIAKGLLYHNFKNKDALYLACAAHCYKHLMDHLIKENACTDIHHYMDTRLRFFQKNASEAHLFFEVLLQPPVSLENELLELRKDLDALNQVFYKKVLDSVKLREDISQEEALQYFVFVQNMFNGYFSSPAFCGVSLSEAINIHETNLYRLLDFILYGIATGEKNYDDFT